MKFTISMKNPDAVSDSIREAVDNSVSELPLSPKERERVAEVRYDETSALCLTVEIDTEAETCVVVESR